MGHLANDIFNEKGTCPETALFVKAPSIHFLVIYTFLSDQICVQLHACTYMSICLYMCAAAI